MALGMTFRGFAAYAKSVMVYLTGLELSPPSPTVTPTNSVPRYAKTAVVKVLHTAKNFPALPASNVSVNPGSSYDGPMSRTEDILVECTRILPILKASGMVIWSSTTSQNETEKNQAENNDDLDRREPELKFTEEFDAEVVDEYDYNQEDRNENTRINLITRGPILDHE